jgi:hypothetical protein
VAEIVRSDSLPERESETRSAVVRDVIYILITLAFFAICVGLVRACDALLGPDEEDLTDDLTDDLGEARPDLAAARS